MDERVLTQELNLFFYPSRDHYLLIPIKEIHRVNSTSVLWREKNSGAVGIVDPDFSLENISAALTRSSVLFLRIEVFEGTHTVPARVAFVAGINKAPSLSDFVLWTSGDYFSLVAATTPSFSSRSCLSFARDPFSRRITSHPDPIIFFSSRIDNVETLLSRHCYGRKSVSND